MALEAPPAVADTVADAVADTVAPSAPGEELLDDLSPSQRRAVTSEARALCILAGAGSGKTRVLTRRIAYRVAVGSAQPQHVLALTFTRRAAGELTSRLNDLGLRPQVAAGTFHSIAYAQLRRRWADLGQRAPTLLERKVRLLAPLLPRTARGSVQPADIAAEIEWAKARMVAPADYAAESDRAGRKAPLAAAVVASLYQRYEEEKRRRALVDFDDLLRLCGTALQTDEQFAATQRWRFRHVFVDEFQDVNPLQHRLLHGWTGDNPDLCVVGDPHQAIYSWNGADSGYLTDFGRRFPDSTVVRLDDNYRSSPQVVTVANAVASGLRSPTTGEATTSKALRAHSPDGPLPTLRSYATDKEEAEGIARALRRRHGSSQPWSRAAVLTRTHAQLVLFQEALRAAAIPYRMRGQAPFLDQPEIRQAVSHLRWLPPATSLASALPDLVEDARAAGVVEATDGPAAERVRNLDVLVRLAREHLATEPAASTGEFVDWLFATLRAEQPDGGADQVELATLHAAKGLEWPVVFLAGLEQGLLPIGHADTAASRAEERRLLYVGVTRAQVELHCSWAERRTFGGRAAARSPSPYLDAVEAAIAALTAGDGEVDWRRLLGEGREQLRASRARTPSPKSRLGQNADPAVLKTLKEWRSSTARASGVPAYVVFHDTTLAALAEAKPRDRQSLLAIAGVGPVKAERYGDAVLAVLTAHGS